MDVFVFVRYWYLVDVCWGRHCCFGGLFPCFGGFDMVVFGCGLDGYVSIWMLIVVFRTLYSSFGVCRLLVGLVWLCMHIIEVVVGSTYL